MQKYNEKIKNEFKKRCYCFSIKIIQLVTKFPKKSEYMVIGNQLLRSATSVGANLVEAQSASSKKDFINYFQISLKSANETKYWLGLIRDGLKYHQNNIQLFLKEINEIANILAASIITMKNKR